MNLVERLRKAAPGTMLSMQVNDLEALREAADEIERLRAALEEIAGCYVDRFEGAVIGLRSGVELQRPCEIARAAIGTSENKGGPK